MYHDVSLLIMKAFPKKKKVWYSPILFHYYPQYSSRILSHKCRYQEYHSISPSTYYRCGYLVPFEHVWVRQIKYVDDISNIVSLRRVCRSLSIPIVGLFQHFDFSFGRSWYYEVIVTNDQLFLSYLYKIKSRGLSE